MTINKPATPEKKMPEESKPPVFYDPKQRRWPRFKRVTILTSLALIALFAVLILSIISFPSLPGLNLTPTTAQFPASSSITSQPEATPSPTNSALENSFQAALGQLNRYLSTPRPAATFLPVGYQRSTSRIKSEKRKGQTPTPTPTRAAHNGERKGTFTPTPKPVSPSYAATLLAEHSLSPTATPALPSSETAVPTPAVDVPTPGPRADSQVVGMFVNWDDNSFTSLKQNISHMDKVVAEWLHLAGADGTIVEDDPVREQDALTFIRQQRPDMPVVTLINNFNNQTQNWDSDTLAKMLADPAARAHTIQGVLDFVQKNHLAGISVDFENAPATSQPDLLTFMQELYAQFHPLGLEVSESVPMNDDSYDYRGLANATDALILMAFDQHWSTSNPGPVAGQDWFASALRTRLAEVSADHFIIDIGNYGYDWLANSQSADALTFQDALQAARNANAQVQLDSVSLNPTFRYTTSTGEHHQVWYLDAVTGFNQIEEAQRYGPRGFALYRLGSEDPSIWQALDHRNQLDQAAASLLEPMNYGYDIEYQGTGEILKVNSLQNSGNRTVTYEPDSGLITGEQIVKFPVPYVITRWGGEDKTKIALTFDDGPDAQYTPQILDILKQYQAPGTFFVIGSEGDQNSTILQREVADGNEIGNHTFTHPDVSIASPEQVRLELAATERLFESRVGRHSLLFRPPYGEDVEPSTPDEVKPVVFASSLGYYTVGMKIDPSDWKTPGVDAIVNAVIDQATSGRGNVVLLHDGGGDRSQTIAALPRIITGLRARGFKLVAVSDLMGLTRDQVMPPITAKDIFVARTNEIGFILIGFFRQLLQNLFFVGLVLGIARLLFIETLAVLQWFKARRKTFPPKYRPSVSVLVPAYNEEKVISNTIHALLSSTYPNLEIIVIDDGSRDGTYARVVEEFGGNPRVKAFTKPNAGKAEALNFGLLQTQAEVVVAQDADTLMRLDAVEKLVRHMADPRIGAVAGNAKVGNRINLLTRWQALEYITSQNLDRRAFAILNCITVVPGAIGAWRRGLLVDAGGFDRDTLAEDADLTMRILRLGYRVEYEDGAIALTEAPDNTRGFLKQRFRWMYGTFQAAWKHKDTILRPKYGALGLVALPNIFIFQILFPLISPIIDLYPIVTIASWFWQRSQHPLDSTIGPLLQMLAYYILFMAIDYLAAATAFILERHEDWRLLILLFPQRFFYRQLMYYVAIRTTLTAIRGRIAGWGKLERKATVRMAE